jgi:hypothetical protein
LHSSHFLPVAVLKFTVATRLKDPRATEDDVEKRKITCCCQKSNPHSTLFL